MLFVPTRNDAKRWVKRLAHPTFVDFAIIKTCLLAIHFAMSRYQIGWAHAFCAHAQRCKTVGKTACPPYLVDFAIIKTCLRAVHFVMSRYRRANVPGATYFFTVVTYRRRPILCDHPVRAALRDAIKTVQSRHPFTIDAWVLLPDHLHCIWTLPSGDANNALRWGLIKRRVSLACANEYHRTDWMTASKTKHRESTFWQRRYWEHCITTDLDYAHHMDYIAINPVKHGLVMRVRDWPYSTFHRDVAQGVYPLDWAGVSNMLDLPFAGEPL